MTAAVSKDLPQLIHLTLTQRKDLTAACARETLEHYCVPRRLNGIIERFIDLKVAVYQRQGRGRR